jgi:hypothetical protein
MQRITLLLVLLCLIPLLLALTAIAIVLTVVLLPITVPVSVSAARALARSDQLLDELGADPDDCALVFVWLFCGAAVLTPLAPLFLAYSAWEHVLAGRREQR